MLVESLSISVRLILCSCSFAFSALDPFAKFAPYKLSHPFYKLRFYHMADPTKYKYVTTVYIFN